MHILGPQRYVKQRRLGLVVEILGQCLAHSWRPRKQDLFCVSVCVCPSPSLYIYMYTYVCMYVYINRYACKYECKRCIHASWIAGENDGESLPEQPDLNLSLAQPRDFV